MNRNIIECRKLCIGYNNKSLTEPFDLDIKHNNWYGIIGSNGTGKSTFFKTLLGNIRPVSGSFTIMNSSSGKSNIYISYIPQEREINVNTRTSAYSLILNSYRAFKWGIPFYNKELKERINEIMSIIGISEYARRPFNKLSGGQKKRVYLAQAMVNKCKLILMDEPLSDLDPASKESFLQALRTLHNKKVLTMMMISHDMHEVAAYLDTFIHFKDNKVHLCNELPCIKETAYVGI